MQYFGDISAGSTIRGSFNTRTSAGTPITLGGTPVLSVYKDAVTTETTTGATLTVDFDSRTGHHVFAIATSDAFYATGADYRVVITTGTVDGISVVGTEVGSFSIENRSALLASGYTAPANADITAIKAKTDNLPSDPADQSAVEAAIAALNNLSSAQVVSALGTGTWATAIPWNAAWDAEVQSEVQDAIEVNHLDHLLAVDYDPASKPGVATALLNELIESDAGVSRYTANALEQAPSGGGGDVLAALVDLEAHGDANWATVPASTESFTSARRGTEETTPLRFTFPVASLVNGDFTKTRWIDAGGSASVSGAVTFLRTIEGLHWYELDYNAADRPASNAAGIVQYLFEAGGDAVGVDLLVSDTEIMSNEDITAIKAKTDNLPSSRSTVEGVVEAGSTTTSIVIKSSTITPTVTDQWKGRIIIFDVDTATAELRGQGAPIANNTTAAITIAAGNALTTAPVVDDTFTVY